MDKNIYNIGLDTTSREGRRGEDEAQHQNRVCFLQKYYNLFSKANTRFSE
jgi:hypothetical protein